MNKGIVYLVGAGPGDPDLLTIKADKIIKKADVIVYDRLLAKKIIETFPINAEKIYVGKESGTHIVPQDQISEILIKKANEGKTVVRLKGGDPFLFGRGGEEAIELKKVGIKFVIVPGITSALAVPAYAGIPVTHRHYASSVTFVTGHEESDKKRDTVNWEKLATATDTLVILMGVKRMKIITDAIIKGGRDRKTPAAAIEWGTTKNQRIVEGVLEDIADKIVLNNVKSPALIIIGEVVKMRKMLSWFGEEN